MKKDRFYEEMDKAFYKANSSDKKNNEKCKDFIVDNNTSYYEVDCRKYKEIMQKQ